MYTDAMRSPEKSLRRDPQRSEKSLENIFFYRKRKINMWEDWESGGRGNGGRDVMHERM